MIWKESTEEEREEAVRKATPIHLDFAQREALLAIFGPTHRYKLLEILFPRESWETDGSAPRTIYHAYYGE